MADQEQETVDRLAEERTKLARERTVLAHIRTGFSSFLFGVALLGLFDTAFSYYSALFFIGLGIFFLATGTASYIWSRERTRRILAYGSRAFRNHKKNEKQD